MKIDNLDRMELSLIKKIETYRSKYYKNSKVLAAIVLMENAKCDYLESTFGVTHKEIQIRDIHIIVFSNSCPGLSVLSVDRWRL